MHRYHQKISGNPFRLAPEARRHYLLCIPGRGVSEGEAKILVVEDDRETASYLVKGLSESGYTVDHAGGRAPSSADRPSRLRDGGSKRL